jgi:hypothetical protein
MVLLALFGLVFMSRGCQTPGPGPDPSKPTQVCVLIVEETHSRTPEQAAILTDAGLRQWLADRGHLLRIVDPDSVTSDGKPSNVLQPYLAWRSVEANRSETLPVCLLVRSDGSVYRGGPLPASSAAVVDWVRTNTAE